MSLRADSDKLFKKLSDERIKGKRKTSIISARKARLKELRRKAKEARQVIEAGRRYDDSKKEMRAAQSGAGSYLPDLVLNLSRVNIFILCYQYHCGASFINLIWLVSSFIFERNTVFFISSILYLPLLTWQYMMVYATDLPIVKDTWLI